ncbi:hypothetical protein [Mycolicibacterium sp. OfavD-34-C]|uniref:DUF7213 family protein n=1 Tax=Mycolicibacterium sp. OfavD-34-C TaxID=2917746 RepID=UPI001EF515A4|nr:hypothetical protein [Mycolicibacterium sp. OfavD-34-C]MCG7582799.1 hypothetical protein [Mycolicibacterium sp. OfavD-34-C]
MSTIHEQREAFALLDDAIDALLAITRDPNAASVEAVLIVGVQRAEDHGAHVGHADLFPRAGAQPAAIRRLIERAGKLLDDEHNDMCAHCGHALAYLHGHNGKVVTHWHTARSCPDGSGRTASLPSDQDDATR